MRTLGVAVQHGVDLEDGRPCQLADIHRLDVLILREVQACCSCRKMKQADVKKQAAKRITGESGYIPFMENIVIAGNKA